MHLLRSFAQTDECSRTPSGPVTQLLLHLFTKGRSRAVRAHADAAEGSKQCGSTRATRSTTGRTVACTTLRMLYTGHPHKHRFQRVIDRRQNGCRRHQMYFEALCCNTIDARRPPSQPTKATTQQLTTDTMTTKTRPTPTNTHIPRYHTPYDPLRA